MSFSRLICGTASCLALSAQIASATPSDSQDKRTGKTTSGQTAGPAKPKAKGSPAEIITVTATGLSQAGASTKTRTPIIESPQTISIVSRDEIELRSSPTIADALAYTAGVQAEPQGIDNRVDEVSVRGFGAGGFSSNNNFVDGLRLPAGGQWTRTSFDPFALQQIDVLKGPSGALYGQTAPGGVVNLVTKRPTEKSEGEFFLQSSGYTDLENWQGQASGDVSGKLTHSGSLTGRMVALAKYGGTQVNDVTAGRYYVSPSLTWKFAPHSTWTLLAQYQRDVGGSTFQFLPATGTLYASKGRYIANDANIGEPDWNTFDRNQALFGSFLEHRFNRFLTVRNNVRYTYLDTLYRSTVLSGDTLAKCASTVAGCVAGETVNRRAVEGRGRSQGVAMDTQVEGHVRTGPVRHLFLAGTDYFFTDWNHDRDLVSATLVKPLLNIFDPVSRGSAGYENNLSPQVYTSTVSRQNGIYFQDQLKFERLRVTIGGRQDWANDNTYNILTRKRYITPSQAFTWRAGGVYLFDNGLAPYFSYAQSFQPTVSDPSTAKNGLPFKPTTGDQYEAGIRYQYGKSIYVTFGGYQITQKNMTTPDPDGETCGTATCLIQTGKGRVRGLELEGRATLPWDMAVIFTGTRSDARIRQSNTPGQVGNYLPQAPKWMASLFIDQRIRYGALRGLGVGGGVRYTGTSYGDTANKLAIPDYTLFDTFLRYDVGDAHPAYKGLMLSLNMRNVANKRFVATCTAVAACYYGQGRNLTARLEYRW
ncbi:MULTISPECIES: TonB-dependent siderophore receptor [Gluconobacter]|uniref:TonB-dependent siderophore receptor n=1 Tax=Gluconobacter cadivus TaxID=2728101 RepID=A0ABR9YYH0_9PROT|nr:MULTISPECIES: TonB-dependent siderophore receptor [Gluconobacter]MBF0889602.1 TonB-dependent siderophore receptor [Gluconobacter cadivus]MBS1061299.1 TonB-dependent siderophore receptor [Gluconobacter sp. Dm-44]